MDEERRSDDATEADAPAEVGLPVRRVPRPMANSAMSSGIDQMKRNTIHGIRNAESRDSARRDSSGQG